MDDSERSTKFAPDDLDWKGNIEDHDKENESHFSSESFEKEIKLRSNADVRCR